MMRMLNLGVVPLIVLAVGVARAEDGPAGVSFPEFAGKHFAFTEITGIGFEKGVTRRDPSDVIKVSDTCYVWYSKVTHADLPERDAALAPSGYVATVWYAASTDNGYTWEERGEALGVGKPGAFDAHAVFTPNILAANGKYYLFYTGVKPTPGRAEGGFANNSTNDFTAIGVAVSDSPDGRFARVSADPVLETSTPSVEPAAAPSKFDSYRVDDASLMVRDGKYWLYYKGRNFDDGEQGPRFTQMGLAVADKPEGPYIKQNDGNPILDQSHEVLIWAHRQGVAAYASISQTVEYAPDGIDFARVPLHAKVGPKPIAPGAFRPDLTKPVKYGRGIQWGISMRDPGGPYPYLVRWEADLSVPALGGGGGSVKKAGGD